jgi:hypothetical protein
MPPATPATSYTIGEGHSRRLAPTYVRHDPLPAAVENFATSGILQAGDRTWPTPSEARMSVIAHAAWHGHSLASITALTAPGRPWHSGLGAAYRRYHHHAAAALSRDFTKAINWLIENPLKHRPPARGTQHTPRLARAGSQSGLPDGGHHAGIQHRRRAGIP